MANVQLYSGVVGGGYAPRSLCTGETLEAYQAVEQEASRVAALYHSARRAGLTDDGAVRAVIYVTRTDGAELLVRCAALIDRLERLLGEEG